jgi:hypothetical protein
MSTADLNHLYQRIMQGLRNGQDVTDLRRRYESAVAWIKANRSK